MGDIRTLYTESEKSTNYKRGKFYVYNIVISKRCQAMVAGIRALNGWAVTGLWTGRKQCSGSMAF
jgi:hypothetical protein